MIASTKVILSLKIGFLGDKKFRFGGQKVPLWGQMMKIIHQMWFLSH
jgi:hypothetical protein